MYWSRGMGFVEVLAAGLAVLFLVLLVVVTVVLVVRWSSSGGGSSAPRYGSGPGPTTPGPGDPGAPMRILEERFARGEIDEEEFRRRRSALRGD